MPELPVHALSLAPQYRELLCRLLRQHLPDAEILAYGSRVRGGGHEASDIDLAVRQGEDPARETPDIARAREALMESNLPLRVEIVDWARIPQSFQEEITQAYVVLQAAKGRQT